MKKILLSAFLIIFSAPAFAEETYNEEKVGEFVEEIGNKIVGIANEKISEKKKRDKIITVVDDVIDSSWIARFVLSKNYQTASVDQRDKFSILYRQFMINTYGPKFKNYNGRKFTVNSVSKQKSFYVAKAEFLPRESNVPISVDFRVKEKDGKLVILDFIAEGISLIETQRSEFNSVISQNGMDEFLKILTARVEKLKSDNNLQ
jgi:phospholipid transport system substrate-binding protein